MPSWPPVQTCWSLWRWGATQYYALFAPTAVNTPFPTRKSRHHRLSPIRYYRVPGLSTSCHLHGPRQIPSPPFLYLNCFSVCNLFVCLQCLDPLGEVSLFWVLHGCPVQHCCSTSSFPGAGQASHQSLPPGSLLKVMAKLSLIFTFFRFHISLFVSIQSWSAFLFIYLVRDIIWYMESLFPKWSCRAGHDHNN